MTLNRSAAALGIFLVAALALPAEVRIKDLATVKGIRENHLTGVGLVTGVSGKGDSAGSAVLQASLRNLLETFGIDAGEGQIKSRNCAVVLVSVELPPFARPGDRVGVTVSSIGDATSLDGGVLLQTPLQAANGEVYAVAQGRVHVPQGARVKTVGTVESGAIVESEVISSFIEDGQVALVLSDPDFTTAIAIAAAVRGAVPGATVVTRDASLVEVGVPSDRAAEVVELIAEIEVLAVEPDSSNRVVVDPQSGVIILGESVRVGRVAVSYRDSQVSVGSASVYGEDDPTSFVMEPLTTVGDFVETMQLVGLEVDVIVGILRAIERAGALYGRLVIM